MRRRLAGVLCAAAVVAGGLVVAVGRADPPAVRPADRPRFEYKVLGRVPGGADDATPEQLNKLGADGWELVSVVVGPPPFSMTTMYLKRAVKP